MPSPDAPLLTRIEYAVRYSTACLPHVEVAYDAIDGCAISHAATCPECLRLLVSGIDAQVNR